MKVVVAEFCQESNSFCPVPTTLRDYECYGIASGDAYRRTVKDKRIDSEGMFAALEERNIPYIPSIMMRAQAGGMIMPEVYRHFLKGLDSVLDGEDDVTGVFLVLHGATQSTESDDVCGDIIAHVREKMGSQVTIAASFDLHANITRRIFENTDIICGFQTYPHIDFYETGYRAAKFGIDRMRGTKDWAMAWVSIPMIEPASGYTTDDGGFGELVERARRMMRDGLVADYTMFQMQPWLDVRDGGSAVVALAEHREAARKATEELAKGMIDLRYEMVPTYCSVSEVLSEAEKNDSGKPIILVDFSDSANAGAAGDNTDVLSQMIAMKSTVKSALIVADGPAVEHAFTLGVGGVGEFSLGGTLDSVHSGRVLVTAKVRSLHDGEFILEGPSRGVVRHVGLSAVLSVGTIDVLVTHAMASTGDPQLYRHFGIEPTFYQMVMVKANTSFYAGYRGLYSKVMAVDTRCAATADLAGLPFIRLPRTFHPFSDIKDYDVVGCTMVKGGVK
jgi:microcystin degradation protein MlrC